MLEWNRTFSVQFRYELDDTKGCLKFYFVKVLPPTFLLIVLVCLLTAFVLILGRLRAVTVPDTVPPGLVFEFSTAVVAFVAGQVLSGLADIGVFLFCFVPLVIVTWFAVKVALNMLFPLFYHVEYHTTRWSTRYDRFFSQKLRRASFFLHLVSALAAVIAILAAVDAYGMSASVIVHSLGILFCLAVVYVFGFYWVLFLRILKRKDGEGKNLRRFKAYLFSDQAIKSSFIESVKFMVIIALLPWFLLPFPVATSTRIAKWSESYFFSLAPKYDTMRKEAEQKLILHTDFQWEKFLPSSGNLRTEFDILSELREVVCPQQEPPVFVRYLFLFVALTSFMNVILRVSTRVVRERGYGNAVRKLVVASLKTTTLVLVLKFFVAKAFLVDFSSLWGLGTAFTYSLAAFLAFQKRDKDKTERTKGSTVP